MVYVKMVNSHFLTSEGCSKCIVNKLSEIISPRKQPTFGDVTGGFPVKCRPRNERRNSILMTCHYPDLGRASDGLKNCFTQSEALTRSG